MQTGEYTLKTESHDKHPDTTHQADVEAINQ